MRQPRLKADARPAGYHCGSRITNGQHLCATRGPGAQEAAYFVGLLHRLATFCGIPILTYALMANHFHLLCQEPQPRELSDPERLDRIEALYGPARRQAEQQVLQDQSPAGQRAAQERRQRYRARMFALSSFLKELKGRFAQGYNRRHGRFGPLWAERFKRGRGAVLAGGGGGGRDGGGGVVYVLAGPRSAGQSALSLPRFGSALPHVGDCTSGRERMEETRTDVPKGRRTS